MLNIIFRGKGTVWLLIALTATEAVCALFYGITLDNYPQYALLGFAVPAGGVLLITGGTLFAMIEVVFRWARNATRLKNSDWDYQAALWCGNIFIIALMMVLVTLASMTDSASAPHEVRLWGWIPLTIFCGSASMFASDCHIDLSEQTGGRPLWWLARMLFAMSFTYLPLHWHFSLPNWAGAAVLGIQAVLGILLLFDYKVRQQTKQATSALKPASAPKPEAAAVQSKRKPRKIKNSRKRRRA